MEPLGDSELEFMLDDSELRVLRQDEGEPSLRPPSLPAVPPQPAPVASAPLPQPVAQAPEEERALQTDRMGSTVLNHSDSRAGWRATTGALGSIAPTSSSLTQLPERRSAWPGRLLLVAAVVVGGFVGMSAVRTWLRERGRSAAVEPQTDPLRLTAAGAAARRQPVVEPMPAQAAEGGDALDPLPVPSGSSSARESTPPDSASEIRAGAKIRRDFRRSALGTEGTGEVPEGESAAPGERSPRAASLARAAPSAHQDAAARARSEASAFGPRAGREGSAPHPAALDSAGRRDPPRSDTTPPSSPAHPKPAVHAAAEDDAALTATAPASESVTQAQPSKAEVIAAMNVIVPELRKCVGQQHGIAHLTLTVRGSGRVSYAMVSGIFAGTPEGSCIARAVRAAAFPRFQGELLRLTYPVRL